MKKEKKGWKEIEIGGMVGSGTSKEFKTGNWKSKMPVWIRKKCTHCFSCVVNCPENTIKSGKDKMTGIDMAYCKGCGICARVCPVKAIKMETGCGVEEV